ncbi:hypothetical protein ACW7G2_10455 [Luteimonas sp. A277]
MSDEDLQSPTPLQLRAKALASWENEGGAIRSVHGEKAASDEKPSEVPPLTNAELS